MSGSKIPGRYKRLFGERTGIIKEVSHLSPDRGAPPVYVSSPVMTDIDELTEDEGRDDDVATDVSGKGLTVEESLLTCIGESVERYCTSYDPDPSELLHGSYREVSANHATVDFEYLRGYNVSSSPAIQQLDRETPLQWAEGTRLTDDGSVLVPDSLVWFHHDRIERYLTSTSNGCAAGPSLEHSVTGSIFEAVERDAMMRMWCLQRSPDLIVDVPPDIEPIVREFSKRGFDIEFCLLESTTGLPVVGCLLKNRPDSIPNGLFASAADFSVEAAMRGALVEVGQGWSLAESTRLEYDLERLSNKDRFENLVENLLYYSCCEGWDDLRGLIEGGGSTSLDSIETVDDLGELLGTLDDSQCDPILFDLTTKDVSDAGLYVTRVFVPELIPYTPPSDLPVEHPKLIDGNVTDMAHPFG